MFWRLRERERSLVSSSGYRAVVRFPGRGVCQVGRERRCGGRRVGETEALDPGLRFGVRIGRYFLFSGTV